MKRKIKIALLIFVLLYSSTLYAQEKKPQGMPLVNVVVSEVSTGMVAPEAEFVGTVYYQEVSDVACEVDGKVEEVSFEEGLRVKKNFVLVKLNSDLVRSDYDKVALDFNRAENLYKEDLISEQAYDERRFEKERLEIIIRKKTIRAPFNGVIIKKHVERGEWLSPGSVVATIARDDVIDIIVEVPESIISIITPGMKVKVKVGEKEINGKIFVIIPQGNISTRTFPVKIRVKNNLSLIEGMEARVNLPVAKKEKVLIVHRDAVITVFGNTVVFAVIDSKAKMIQVKVIGYKGMKAGIQANGLKEGIKVVVKGNERLRDGQIVKINE
jgi:RND family efflux transporter MFP subunit